MRKAPDLTALDQFTDELDGPLSVGLQATGSVMARRLDARGQALSDLNDAELVDLFLSAF